MTTGIFGDELTLDSQSTLEEDVSSESQLDEQEEIGAPEEGQPQVDPDSGQPKPSERKYAERFNTEDDLVDGYINIMDYLGRETETFTSVEDLENAYLEAVKERGRQPKTTVKETKTNPELEQLRMTVAQQQQQMQQMVGYLQGLAQQNQEAQKGQQQKGQPIEEVDPATLLDEFYANPQKTLGKMLEPMLNQQLQQMVPQYTKELEKNVNQQLQPVHYMMQMERLQSEWVKATEDVRTELVDFDEVREAVAQEVERDPNLLMLAEAHPEGKKFVIRTAYDRVKAMQAQKAGIHRQAEDQRRQSVLQKQAAKMNSSKRVLVKEPSVDELTVRSIFGESENKKGIFG